MIKTLICRPRFSTQRSAKVKPRRSPKINILKAFINTVTVASAIACLGYLFYGIYLALPHIGYGLWLMLPCIAMAAIVALFGASCQAFLQTRGDRHE